MLSIFDLIALLLVLSATLSWVNRRFIGLPHAVGLLVLGLVASLLLLGAEVVFPDRKLAQGLTAAVRQIDFTDVVMNGMLAFLLFAGALNLNLQALRDRALPVAVLSLVGTVISTVLVGVAFWAVSRAVGPTLPLTWALVFGALISPTDPVAVLAALKHLDIPASLEIEMQGEALFNDGVGVVLFTLLTTIATHDGGGAVGVGTVLGELARDAGGGLLLGAVTGYLGYRAMRSIDDYPVEVLITLALVAGTYALAQKLGVSGPLAVVAAGLIIADRAPRDAMSDTTSAYVTNLWTLIDEVLNAVLFLLIGLEVAVLRFQPSAMILALLAIPIVLVARLVAVSAPLLVVRWGAQLSLRNVPFLTWAGVRGAISVALALALPDSDVKPAILAATYAIVLFTIIVQGLTLKQVARLTLVRRNDTDGATAPGDRPPPAVNTAPSPDRMGHP